MEQNTRFLEKLGKCLEGAFIPPPVLPPWIVIARSEATKQPRSNVTRPRGCEEAALGERCYNFTQAPFAFDDFTAASTKARPFTPSSIVGNSTPSGGFIPKRAALIASATSL